MLRLALSAVFTCALAALTLVPAASDDVSAGSASIGLLLTSPLAAGLFDRAILHSPGALRPLCPLRDAQAARYAA